MSNTNGINMFVSGSHLTMNADITFEVTKQGDIDTAHLADVIQHLVFEKTRAHDQARLAAGSFRLSMTLVCSATESEAKETEEQAQDLVKEMLGGDLPESEDK